MLRIGAIADDHTGATDLATTLVSRGYRTTLIFGVPGQIELNTADTDAVVIGLKTRSAPVDRAVAESRAAARLLSDLGCQRIYDKYCATFDSTAEGNIGPILDALMDEVGARQTVVVLPFPEAGRTVYNGHLFVDGVPLDQTSMRHHPLTPMTDSRILRLLAPQTRRQVREIRYDVVADGAAAVRSALHDAGEAICVVDAISRTDLDTVADAVTDMQLISGGAGLAASFTRVTHPVSIAPVSIPGLSAILAGSASAENQRQIAHAQPQLPSRKLSLDALRTDFTAEIDDLTAWAVRQWRADPARPVLVYSVGEPGDVDLSEHPDGEPAAALTERALAACATSFVAEGVRRLIVAGGETSGSVTTALGVQRFDVDAPLCPGVAWARTRDAAGRDLAVLLKSGSLGTVDIFSSAWARL